MKLALRYRIGAVVVALIACVALALSVVALATDDGGCHVTSADGTSSLHVSKEALQRARDLGATITSDDGLVCE